MAKFVYLQFHNDMALQNAVIEYEVGKEIIFINQDTFLPGFKAETMSHFQQEVLQVIKNGLFQIVSVTNARSFNPKNSKVTGVLITSLGCNKVTCCWTKAERASLFWIVRYVRNIKMRFAALTLLQTSIHE